MNEQDKEDWLNAVTNVQPLDQKEQVSWNDKPVRTSPARELLGYDLHGMTVQQAFEHTRKLIERAFEYGLPQIQIITGKSGQIRQEFEAWMENPSIGQFVRYVRLMPTGGSYWVYLHRKD